MHFRPKPFVLLLSAAALAGGAGEAASQERTAPSGWRQHEMTRPHAPPLTPPPAPLTIPAPSDAVVLFDGRDLSRWVTANAQAGPARWKVENGYMEVTAGTGSIRTREEFGDVQMHLEWASPSPAAGNAQDRGNSGVILMGRYEIQVLDSYQRTDTYADGTAGSIYGQYPPLVNASRAPGEWQSYDIFFRRPRFNRDSTVAEPARVTVLHNGVLVQNNEMVFGATAPPPPYAYIPHDDAEPITLQDHSHPVRYRNVWVRRIGERPEPAAGYRPTAVTLTPAQLDRLVGVYYRAPAAGAAQATGRPIPTYTVSRQNNRILVRSAGTAYPVEAVPIAENRLWVSGRASELVFTLPASGPATEVNAAGSTAAPARRR